MTKRASEWVQTSDPVIFVPLQFYIAPRPKIVRGVFKFDQVAVRQNNAVKIRICVHAFSIDVACVLPKRHRL